MIWDTDMVGLVVTVAAWLSAGLGAWRQARAKAKKK
jgi:hypothetical protein